MATSAQEVIEMLALAPHPEVGHYRETWCEQVPQGERGAGSAIYYLLREGEAHIGTVSMRRRSGTTIPAPAWRFP